MKNNPTPIDQDPTPSPTPTETQRNPRLAPTQRTVLAKAPDSVQLDGTVDQERVLRKPGYRDGVHIGDDNLVPFQPGQSGNPNGRPPDLVKGIALRLGQLQAGKILSPKEQRKLERLGLANANITILENIILDWATSKNPIKQQMYMERVAGKVPNINLNAQINESLVQRFRSKFTDSELEEIAAGADAAEILFAKLPDVDGSDNIVDAFPQGDQ